MKNNALFALVFFVITGCAATGKSFPGYEPLDSLTGEIIIYRPSKFVMSGDYVYLYVNGQRISKLKNKGFIQFRRPPGKYTLEIRDSTTPVWSVKSERRVIYHKANIEIEPAKRYVFKFEPSTNGFIIGTYYPRFNSTFLAVPEDVAITELGQLKNSFEE